MTDEPKKILIVEDKDDHYELIRRGFEQMNGLFHIGRAKTLREARERTAVGYPDLVIADWKLPDGDGIELIVKDRSGVCRYPVILMTSHGNESWAVAAVKMGALDYIVKSPGTFSDIPRIVQRAFSEWDNIAARRRAEESLSASEQRLKSIIDSAPFGAHFYRLEAGGRLIFTGANATADRILRTNHSSLIGRTIEEAFPGLQGTDIPGQYRRIASSGGIFEQDQVDYDAVGIRGAFEVRAFQTGTDQMAAFFHDITERKRAEAALKQSEEQFFKVFQNSPVLMAISTIDDGCFVEVNKAFLTTLGFRREEVVGRTSKDLGLFADTGQHDFMVQLMKETGHVKDCAVPVRARNGEVRDGLFSGEIIELRNRKYLLTVMNDMTDLKKAEAEKEKLEIQLRQAQKMEAIGTLAGGVAHDFNNMLSAIVGYASLLQMKMRPDDPLRSHIEQIIASTERASGLTQSLLAFSRKQVAELMPVNIKGLITGFQKILSRIIGEDIDFRVSCPRENLVVAADKGQLEQVLMNLATNARDAMPKGGTLQISVDSVEINSFNMVSHAIGVPGSYVCIAITDTGIGMEKAVQEHIFEPFFTTKECGKGTGLGLSIVYGIIKKHNGFINAYSESGRGTTFKIYLPLIPAALQEKKAAEQTAPPSGRERVLLVEDDAVVRQMARSVLEEYGYTVVEAVDGDDAVSVFHAQQDRIDLVLCDLIMPKKNGREVYEEMKRIRPDVKTIFMSGYPADIIEQKGILEHGVTFLAKPLNPHDLLTLLRRVLGP